MKSESLDISCLDVPIDEIFLSMGFKDARPDETSRQLAESLLHEAAGFVHPVFEYVILDGMCSVDRVRIGRTELDVGRVIGNQLRGSSRFAVFVCTAGQGWADWKACIDSRDDILQSFTADCIGSQLVESTADYMISMLDRELESAGLKMTNRFSPGYCGWPVAQQPELFDLFPEKNPCGVSLTESCLMIPVKSVSGIVGLGKDVVFRPYMCNICTMEMCFRRRHHGH